MLGCDKTDASPTIGKQTNDCRALRSFAEDKPKFSQRPSLRSGRGTAIVHRVARVAELADAPDLGSGSERIGGSSPLARTTLDVGKLGRMATVTSWQARRAKKSIKTG